LAGCGFSSIFGWLRLRLAVSAKLGLPTSRPAFCFLASLVLAGAKTKPNFFTSPYHLLVGPDHLLSLYLVEAPFPSKGCRAKGMKDAHSMSVLQVFLVYRLECK